MDAMTSIMPMSSMTPTAPAAAASSSAMGGMSMGGMGPNACKISMLWNWYTVDACFISSTWQITSAGMFAGSCIGVICLVMALEALRRAAREYDAYIMRRALSTSTRTVVTSDSSDEDNTNGKNADVRARSLQAVVVSNTFTPSIVQQLVRALLHMLQFGVAYFIMLLAMYYNGYVIICILIGAFIGSFIFSWHKFDMQSGAGQREITYCCG